MTYHDDNDSCDSCNFSEFNSESETEDDNIDVVEEEDTEYKIIVASDGFWDMIIDEEVHIKEEKHDDNEGYNNDDEILADSKNGANELMQIVINRWNQPWTYINKDTKSVSKDVLIGTGDDISIGVWVGKI